MLNLKSRSLYIKLKAIKNIGISICFVNFLFQRIFRIDSDFKYMKNYTSRVSNGKNIVIKGTDSAKIQKVLNSFSVSGNYYVNALRGLEIGEGTIFSFGVVINSAGHDVRNLEIVPDNPPIKIGKDCWIGANVVIVGGVKLGDNVIVGANSVVTKSFGNNVIIAGVPAKIISYI